MRDLAKNEDHKMEGKQKKGFHIGEDITIGERLADKVKLETSLLENRYLKWIISIGIAFLIVKAIGTAREVSYLKGRQESFERTVNTLLEDRRALIDDLRGEIFDLKSKELDFKRLQLENDRLNNKLKNK